MKALLLAAGKGERFFPFSTYRAKPMFPVCNRPLLAWLVDRVIAACRDRGIPIRVGINEGGIVERKDKSRRAGQQDRH